MTRTLVYILVGLVVLVGLLAVDGRPQSQNGDDDTSQNASEPIAVRHAQAAAELAEVELQIAQELNERVPDAIPESRVDWLATNADLARERVEMTGHLSPTSTPPLQAAYADAMAGYAQREYEAAKQVKEADPAAMSDLQLERQRLMAKVADLRAEMWREHAYQPLLVEQLQWQIDRLAEEVVELNHRVQELE